MNVKTKNFSKILLTLSLAFVMTVISVAPEAHASTVEAAGRLYAWGRNDFGQFGNGNFDNAHTPIRMPNAPGGVADWNELELLLRGHSGRAITPDGRLFVWGLNANGQLGLGHTDVVNTPTENENLPPGVANWNDVEFIVAGDHNFVRTTDGRLFVWGFNAEGRLGLGHTDVVNTPTENENLPPGVANWNDVEFVELACMVSPTFVLARTSAGRLFVWGRNISGELGLGHTDVVNTPTENENLPPGVANWNDVEILQGVTYSFARTNDGRLFAWGANAAGQLGLGHNLPRHAPTEMLDPLPGMPNWNGVNFTIGFGHTVVRTPDGRLFVWGGNAAGQLGLGDNFQRHAPAEMLSLLPGTTSWNDVELVTGTNHTFAITPEGRMFAWGRNPEGNLGLNHTGMVNAPTENTNLPSGVDNWNDVELFVGGHDHTFARVRPFPPVDLIKTLQLNEGTTIPEVSFIFNFTPRQVQLSDDPAIYSRPVADVPAIDDQTIAIDTSTATTNAGITTVTGSLDLWTLIENALDAANVNGGVFVWEVNEVVNSSNVNASLDPNTMTYDTSHFQVRAHVNRHGELVALEVFEMEESNGQWNIILPKLDEMNFTNIYTRTVDSSLYISKELRGDYANHTTPFTFTLTLTNPALTPPAIGAVEVVVVDRVTGNPVIPARTVDITSGVNTFTLAHNEMLRIPNLPSGTLFQITETAHTEFEPEASVTGIAIPPSTGTYPRQEVNTALTTGTYIIYQEDESRADFINHHRHTPPTGLIITTAPWIALIALALLLALVTSSRRRKRIEEMPLTF